MDARPRQLLIALLSTVIGCKLRKLRPTQTRGLLDEFYSPPLGLAGARSERGLKLSMTLNATGKIHRKINFYRKIHSDARFFLSLPNSYLFCTSFNYFYTHVRCRCWAPLLRHTCGVGIAEVARRDACPSGALPLLVARPVRWRYKVHGRPRRFHLFFLKKRERTCSPVT
eukprot:COSAG05_NODE_893_length_6708_cov_2.153427_8_plen_170_part_00